MNYITIEKGFEFVRNGVNIKQDIKGGIPISRIETIANGVIDFNRVGYAGIYDENKYADYYLQDGDILMSHINSETHLGKTAIFEGNKRLIHGMNLLCLRPNKKLLFPKYMLYYFKRSEFKKQIVKITKKAVNQASFSISDLKKIEVPLPPLPEQKRIASILDKADAIRKKRQETIRLLDEFLQGVFLEMFGSIKGDFVLLSKLCDINPSKNEVIDCDKNMEVTFLPMSKVLENGKIDLSETRRLSEVLQGFTYFKENDVLFAKITPCMENGKGAIARRLCNGIGFGSTEFHVLRPKPGISSEWLFWLTKTKYFREKAEKRMTGSAGQKRVPQHFFDEYKTQVPPIELQKKFTQIVEKTEQQKQLLEKSLAEMNNCFNSLMQRAFRGEL